MMVSKFLFVLFIMLPNGEEAYLTLGMFDSMKKCTEFRPVVMEYIDRKIVNPTGTTMCIEKVQYEIPRQ
jgi:hypothetical protein